MTLTIGERHKCEFLASGAVREVVVAVQLETGNDLVVRPRQGDGIIGGFRNILLKSSGSGDGACGSVTA